MTCEGSKEVSVSGTATQSYSGLRTGFRSFFANIIAHLRASSKADQNIAAAKSTIFDNLCGEGCECEISDFENPTAFNNPTVSWTPTATTWFGISTAGRYTVTYYYIVKAECVDVPEVLEGVAPVTGGTITGQ